MVRGALGVVVGAIAWMAAFFSVARLLFLVWPDYALHAQSWNLAVAVPAIPAVLLGGKLAGRTP